MRSGVVSGIPPAARVQGAYLLVSLIIPAHDEVRLIARTVGNLFAAAGQAGLACEVIVADDASTDGTGAAARGAGAIVVRHERRQIAATRNLGARVARGRLLIFVDADTWPSSTALRQAVEAMESGAAGGGASMRFDGRVPLYARLIAPLFNFAFRIRGRSGGAFFFCRREALQAVGGWDESVYAGEEINLAVALKEIGPFAVIREPVLTSGRKLRSHSGWELLGVLLRLVRDPRSIQKRENLDVWYGPRRRDDPDRADGSVS
ncbi:MAG TPA: glycosyltransferase [Phycisphaerales bacterium]|nr:glycosyltransferase [Phycisphaerales bacterium]